LESCIDSLSYLGDLHGHFVIVFDGYKESIKEALKSGKTSAKGIENYEIYKTNAFRFFIKKFNLDPQNACKFYSNYTLGKDQIELDITQIESKDNALARKISLLHVSGHALGFAHAVNCGLQFVQTPLVLVLQHDWMFVKEIPLEEILDEMLQNDEITYITFPTKWNLVQQKKWEARLDHSKIPLKRLSFWYFL
jgi:hypothetical protein